MEMIAVIPRDDESARYFRAEVEDHWRYAQASTVASGSTEIQRILLSREILAAS
jgi:alkylation response protein AidB-like acyl-CoA dehydrogenase